MTAPPTSRLPLVVLIVRLLGFAYFLLGIWLLWQSVATIAITDHTPYWPYRLAEYLRGSFPMLVGALFVVFAAASGRRLVRNPPDAWLQLCACIAVRTFALFLHMFGFVIIGWFGVELLFNAHDSRWIYRFESLAKGLVPIGLGATIDIFSRHIANWFTRGLSDATERNGALL